MNILIVSQYYWPEDFAAGVYVPELAERLAAFGHDVTVITGPPNYPTGRILQGYNRLLLVQQRNNVRVVRGWFVPSPRSSGALRRGLTALSFALSAVCVSPAVRHRPDVILSLSPPIFMAASAALLAKRWRVPWLLNVKDLFSEAVLASGLASPGVLMSGIAALERRVYRNASRIVTNSAGFADYLRAQCGVGAPVSIIPDWADGNFIRPLPRDNEVRRDWGLQHEFVVLYSGSIGYSSGLETAIEAAAELRDCANFRLVIVGDGVKLPALRQKVDELRLSNVLFFPLQPLERVPSVLAAADVTLVSLSASGGRVSTQGKLYSLLAAGRPVIALVPRDNDARAVVDSAGCGWSVDPGDATALAAVFRRAADDRVTLEKLGGAARARFEKEFSLEICARQFEEQLIVTSGAAEMNVRTA